MTNDDEIAATRVQQPAADAAQDDGELIEIELTDLAHGGDAVGRYQGRAVFVPGGLPGELVRVRLTRERSNYARATLVDVLRPSPDRLPPRYPELADSGGFQWQHLAYPAQVTWKGRIVRQLLMRIGKFTDPPVQPTLGMPEGVDPWRYRTVAQFAVGPDGALGFRRAGSHDVLDMPTCPIVHPALDTIYQHIRAWMRERWGASASTYTERFTVRVATNAPRHMHPSGHAGLLTIEAKPGSAFDEDDTPRVLADALLAAVPDLAGVVILGLPGGRGRVTAGQDFVFDQVLDRTFRISAGSFFQVNVAQTPVLVHQVLDATHLRSSDRVLEGYSGVGLFSLFLAERAAHIHAVESQPSAVADARISMTLNGITNATITEGVLERVLGTLGKQGNNHNHNSGRVDVALVDPPRSGCHPRALAELMQLAPRTFVYISCDPSTLARDLQQFCANGEYRLVSVQPIDMFPFTAHIESVAVCERV